MPELRSPREPPETMQSNQSTSSQPALGLQPRCCYTDTVGVIGEATELDAEEEATDVGVGEIFPVPCQTGVIASNALPLYLSCQGRSTPTVSIYQGRSVGRRWERRTYSGTGDDVHP